MLVEHGTRRIGARGQAHYSSSFVFILRSLPAMICSKATHKEEKSPQKVNNNKAHCAVAIFLRQSRISLTSEGLLAQSSRIFQA